MLIFFKVDKKNFKRHILSEFPSHHKILHKAFSSFIEEMQIENIQNSESYYVEPIEGFIGEDRCLLIGKKKHNVYGYIFLDKYLFNENIFNLIKNHHYYSYFSDYLPDLAKEMKNQFNIKYDKVFGEILHHMQIKYYNEGDCVFISTVILDFFETHKYDDMHNLLLREFTTLSSYIIKFFSKPEYYKNIIGSQILVLKQTYKARIEEIERIKKDLKLLEKV